jgi:CelD/BcsL family acetyltransferase involved in cellulose biosynthesis
LLRTETVRTLSELAAVRGQWSDLLERSDSNHPFLSPEWMLSWWRVYGPLDRRRLRAVLVRDGDRLVGLAPFLLRDHRYRNLVPFRRLEMLGSGESEADEVCSDYLGVIAEAGLEDAAAGAVVAAIVAGELGAWDEVVVWAADGDSTTCESLRQALVAADLRTEVLHDPGRDAPYIELPDSWDAYLAMLSSSRRAYVRRSLRDLDKFAGGEVVVRIAGPGELREARDILIELHNRRWQSRPGGSVFDSALFAAFHERVMPALADRDALQLLWVEVAGKPLAALYNIVWNNKIYFYQSGREIDVPKKVRPGIAIHALAIKQAIADGRSEYDFLAGMGEYATRLSNARRPIVALRATRRRSPVELARRAMEGCVGQIRRVRDRRRAKMKEDAAT